MMIGSRQASNCLQDRTNVTRNENVSMMSPQNMRKVIVSPNNSFQTGSGPYISVSPPPVQNQTQPYSRILQNQQYYNPSHIRNQGPRMSPGSPRKYEGPASNRIIELGGSKEKMTRRSRERSPSNCSQQTRTVHNMNFQSEANNMNFQYETGTPEFGSVEEWRRKAMMLQNRVKQLHKEKQYLAMNFNNKIADLERENRRLASMLNEHEKGCNTNRTKQRSRSRSNQSQKQRNSYNENFNRFGQSCSQFEGFGKSSSSLVNASRGDEEQFNVEEMLANQIEVNLELREQIEKYCQEIQQYKIINERQNVELDRYKHENADLKLESFQGNSEDINSFKEKIMYLENELYKKGSASEIIVQEKEKRIVELENEVFDLTSRLNEKDQYLMNVQRENSSLKMSRMNAGQINQNLKNRLESMQRGTECMRCKEMKNTIFRLNSQLSMRR